MALLSQNANRWKYQPQSSLHTELHIERKLYQTDIEDLWLPPKAKPKPEDCFSSMQEKKALNLHTVMNTETCPRRPSINPFIFRVEWSSSEQIKGPDILSGMKSAVLEESVTDLRLR